jgi:uncharacterized protein (TIGR03435 family)
MRLIAATISTIFFCCGAYGQSAANLPSFVAASVKPAAPPNAPGGGPQMMGRHGGPGTPDPRQLTCMYTPLSALLTTAYGLKRYQINGPNWLDSERFDVVEKLPGETTKEQYRLMLQNLLAERFKLTLHHQTKELPMYALVVGKDGPKMKPSEEEPAGKDATSQDEAPSAPLPPPPTPPTPSPGLPERPKMDADGFPVLPPGMRKVTVNMMNAKTGRFRMLASHESMPHLAEMLGNRLGRPVMDETGLKGLYDFILEYAPGESVGPMAGIPPPPPGGENGAASTAGSPDAAGLFSAIQAQIGLKLQQKKGPVDLLVIDRLEKVPTEN